MVKPVNVAGSGFEDGRNNSTVPDDRSSDRANQNPVMDSYSRDR